MTFVSPNREAGVTPFSSPLRSDESGALLALAVVPDAGVVGEPGGFQIEGPGENGAKRLLTSLFLVGNSFDDDLDQDRVPDLCHNCPAAAGLGADQTDSDGDGICGDDDNCPLVANAEQINLDALPAGNACQCGDGTGEGRVDILDRALVARYAAGLPINRSIDLNRCSMAAPDASCDDADAAAIGDHLAADPRLPFGLPDDCAAAGS